MNYLDTILVIISALSLAAAAIPTENDYKSSGRIKNLIAALRMFVMKL